MLYSTTYLSPLGSLLLISDGESLTGLWLEKRRHFSEVLAGELEERDDLALFATVGNWLERYFGGGKPSCFELPLAPSGSEFRRLVWDILCTIPYGECVTYGWIAERIASQRNCGGGMSARAVGGAVGHNPISIIIPCHRVVGAGGSLTGFGGGIPAKIKLLAHEGVDVSRFSVPKKGTAL